MSLQPKQFQQMQMFMQPSEVVALRGFEFGDQFPGEPTEDLRREKLGHARLRHYNDDTDGGNLVESITAHGIRRPLQMRWDGSGAPTLTNGHHRFFVQEMRERAGEEVYVPLVHRQY